MMRHRAEYSDVKSLKEASEAEFAGIITGVLSQYDINTPGFNFLAKANIATPFKNRFYFFPEETQSFIGVSLKALEEYDETKIISPATRERFIIEYTKDILRNIPEPHDDRYRAFCEKTMEQVMRELKGVETLATVTYTFSKGKNSI